MKRNLTLLAATFLLPAMLLGQSKDTSFITAYPQKIRLSGSIGTDYIQIKEPNNQSYTPNYPFILGAGLSIKNTLINFQVGYGLFSMESKEKNGKTRSIDLQLHKYWQDYMVDLSFQRYSGFYSEDSKGMITGIYPNMRVLRTGGEISYILNGSKYSAKAAFGHDEKQQKSAGSLLIGCKAYLYNVDMDKNLNSTEIDRARMLLLGAKVGYGYSWVLNERWLLAAVVSAGAAATENTKELSRWNIRFVPTSAGRFAATFQKKAWTAGLIVIVGDEQLYTQNNNRINLTSIAMQLSYCLYLDKLF